MKLPSLLSILAISAIALFSACKNDGDTSKDVTLMSEEALTKDNTPAPASKPTAPEPPQNAAGIWHYTCPKGCAGGSGSATACTTCGTTLTHNQIYHSSEAPSITPDQAGTPGQKQGVSVSANQAEPPQNAAGVWHFICSKGCTGGTGAEGNCPKCGKPLLHNNTYHQ